ncbi:hypothetical protein SARC_12357 [Sphaeroforma arctica JP610]|uniref:Chromatin modification-related protein MEAF6 n=1 Tax=Sphaeroforma arctica JP610 TaxID=667725 RepID=A0A0L0FEC4_9EUKA|nr:hypothetical protein SARC_12357 [Sphaeroforma arctica JP610]KNC75109.1 hypothetical protein SARC_12357 [Sphaeroforma arctica JP610]|eukprot:XP_014149011.1 hypothetical protein SARC_12357 [Sphaeroforma arctica JP610]
MTGPDPKQELEELLSRQHQIEDTLTNLERQIYEYEGSYLEETQVYGNLFRGFDGFASTATVSEQKSGQIRKCKSSDRLFSRSSCTSNSALESVNASDTQRNSNKKGDVVSKSKKSGQKRSHA